MQKIRIDFDNPGLPQHISAVENDSQSRFFQATLYENGKAYTAPEGATYSIMYRGFGPQNQGWYDTINDGAGKRAACAVSGNVVTCEIARQALQVPGHVSIVLCVTTGKGYMLKSWPIECDCKNDRYDSTVEIQSFFYVTQISNESWTQAIQAVEELKNTIDPTLSLSGKAADAAKVGEAVGQVKEDLNNTNNQLFNATPNLYYKSGNTKKYPLYCAQADINGDIIMETTKSEDSFITNTPVRLYIAFSDVSQASGKTVRIRAGDISNRDIARKDINIGLVDNNTKVTALNIDISDVNLSNAVFNDIRLLPATVGATVTVTNIFATTDMETDYSKYVSTNKYNENLLIPKKREEDVIPIMCIGDSMINAGGEMTSKLKELTDLSDVFDYGVGGDNVLSTLAHIGESPFLVEPFMIPSDTKTTPISIKSSFNGGAVNPAIEWYENGACTIHGIKGIITYPDHTTRKDYEFQRSKAGNSEIIERDEFVILDSGITTQSYKSFIPIVWFGTNGGWKSIDELVQIHERIAKYCNGRNFIFIGFYMYGNTPISTIEEYERLMESHFGYKFINMRKYLVENGLSICNIPPTDDDNRAISEGKVPPSLLADGVHYTADVKDKIVMPLIIERLKLMNLIS